MMKTRTSRRPLSVSMLVATMLLVVACAAAVAQDTKEPAASRPAAGQVKKEKKARHSKGRLPNFFRTVVSEEQREKIYAIQQEYDPEIRELRERIKTLTAERNEKIDAVLTPEQRKEIEGLREAAKEKRRKTREEKAAEPAKETTQRDGRNRDSEPWQTDFDRFVNDLRNKRGIIPTPESLNAKSGVRAITDGAGGLIDPSPAPHSLQYVVNRDYSGKRVRWEIGLESDMQDVSWSGRAFIAPRQRGVKATRGQAEADAGVLWIELKNSDLPRGISLKKGSVLLIEGTIGNAAQTSLREGHRGVNVAYHLESTAGGNDRTGFIIGLDDARISREGL